MHSVDSNSCLKFFTTALTVACILFILFIMFTQQGSTSNTNNSVIVLRQDAAHSGIQNDLRSLVTKNTPVRFNSPSSTLGTTLQPATATMEHPSTAGTSVNSSVTSATRKYSPIDMEKEMPPLEEIFKRTVIVTAVSSNHFMEVQRMIEIAQRVMPNTRIVLYNLGLAPTQVQTLSTLCNVEVRQFNFSTYPAHVKDLLNYAWKPPIIKEALYEFGAVFWADSSVRFKKSIKLLTTHLQTFHGFIPRVANYAKQGKFSVLALTHPAMFDYMKIDIEAYRQDEGYTPKPQGGILYVVNSSYIIEKVVQPWVDCAMVLECIAPPGSQNPHVKRKPGYHVHRYDQSALALLMYKNLRGLYHRGHDATKTFNAIMRIDNAGPRIKNVKVRHCQHETL